LAFGLELPTVEVTSNQHSIKEDTEYVVGIDLFNIEWNLEENNFVANGKLLTKNC
jgi:hypothetical protein